MSIRIDGTNTTANPGITGSDTDTGLQFGTNEVKIVTDGSDRVTVDSSGRVGINTTTFDDTATALVIKNGASNSEHSFLDIVCDTNESARVRFSEDGSTFPGEIRYNTFNHDLLFTVNSSERMRILSGGGLTFNGDTAAANALDDYEEGTWTPTINITTSPISGITYTRQAGYYTKIGNVCHVSMWVTWSARTSTSSSAASISLPFTSKSSSDYRGAMHVSTENCTYNDYGFDSSSTRNIGAMAGTHLGANVAYMELSFTGKNGGAWGSAGLLINGLGASGGNMQLAGTYLVA